MKVGDSIYTPRFCTVKIAAVYEDRAQAYTDGFNEPSHYKDTDYDILGKPTGYFSPESGLCGVCSMIFAAVKK